MHNKKNSFIKSIKILGLILILGGSSTIVLFEFFSNKIHFNNRSDQIRKNYNNVQKKNIKDEVMKVVRMIKEHQLDIEIESKNYIKYATLEAFKIAENIYNENIRSKNKTEISKMIVDALRPIRFHNDKGYFFATDLNGVEVLFADKPELEGKNMLEIKDINGQFVVKDMIDIAKKSKEGFYEYHWTKPNEIGNNHKKISYIKLFEQLNFFIGSGLYTDDVADELKMNLLKKISKIRFDKEGYIFVNTFEGDALVSNGKYEGGRKKLWEVFNKNPKKTKQIFKISVEAANKKNGDYIYYSLGKLSNIEKVTEKVSFIYGLPNLNLYIGAGIYLDDVGKELDSIHNTLNTQLRNKLYFFVLFIILFTTVFLLIISKFSKKLENDYKNLINYLNKNITSNEDIDLDIIKFKEFNEIAENANMMSKAFRSSENRYRKLFDDNPISMWEEDYSSLKIILDKIKANNEIVDKNYFERNSDFLQNCLKEMKILNINKTTLKLLKYKNNEDIEVNYSNICNNISLITLSNIIIAIFNSKKTFSEQSELICSDGEIISVIIKYQVIGNYDKIILTIIDITPRIRFEKALKESEQHFRSIIDQSPISIQVFDRTGLMINANQAWEKVWGIDSRVNHINRYNILTNEAIIELGLEEKIKEAFKGNQVKIAEIKYSNKLTNYTGGIRYVKFEAYPLNNPDGSFTNIVCFTEDITNRKLAEKEMKKVRNLESLGTLAGGIAHDFNNILMGLFGSISMAKVKISIEHPSYSNLENAEKSLDRATRLTKQLLTFAKGGSPIKENISLSKIVIDTINFDLSGSNVKPIYEIDDNLWTLVGDKGQIQQVFSNLTINANHSMEKGGFLYIVMENITIENSENSFNNLKQGKYIKILIRDEGTGIESEKLEKIFDPYFTTKKTGSGLGLATVYSIINKHEGFISLESEIGIGSAFTIYLPAEDDSIKDIDEVNINDKNKSSNNSELKKEKPRILIMDDEEMVLTVTKEMLEVLGNRVETVSDGKQAIDVYAESINQGDIFDCVFMDLTIPGGMGGKETIKEIIKIDKNAKVIVSSGYASDPIMSNYLEYGFKAVIEKPFTMELLKKTLNDII